MLRYKGKEFKMRDREGKTFTVKQVTATIARKVFEEGKTIWLQACNLMPNTFWHDPYPVTNKEGEFEKLVNAYKYYECNTECGRYPIYFIPAA